MAERRIPTALRMASGRATGRDLSRHRQRGRSMPRRMKRSPMPFHHTSSFSDLIRGPHMQGFAISFRETGIEFLRATPAGIFISSTGKRSGVHVEAVAHAIRQGQKQEDELRGRRGNWPAEKPLLRIAVWHHAVAGPDQMKETEFLGNLQKNGVRLALHGDVHELQRQQVGYRHEKQIHVVGSGSFVGPAPRIGRSPHLGFTRPGDRSRSEVGQGAYPWPSRSRTAPGTGWHEWPDPDGGKGRLPFYDIRW